MVRLKRYALVTMLAAWLSVGCDNSATDTNPYSAEINVATDPTTATPQARHDNTTAPVSDTHDTEENRSDTPAPPPIGLDETLTQIVHRCEGKIWRFSDDRNRTFSLCAEEKALYAMHQEASALLIMLMDAKHAFTRGVVSVAQTLQNDFGATLNVVVVDINGTVSCPQNDLFCAVRGDISPLIARWRTHRHAASETLPLPWIHLYENGRAVRRYRGIVPVEILRRDIKTYCKEL